MIQLIWEIPPKEKFIAEASRAVTIFSTQIVVRRISVESVRVCVRSPPSRRPENGKRATFRRLNIMESACSIAGFDCQNRKLWGNRSRDAGTSTRPPGLF
jgi:hypothetical protein